MTRADKLRKRLLAHPADFTWAELVAVLNGYGYELRTGSGSRRSFQQEGRDAIYLHQPHPSSVMKAYQLRLVIDHLRKEGQL